MPDRPYGFTPAQITELLKPINPSRVFTVQGNSHVPAYDDIAQLNYVFGFDGWDKQVIVNELVYEDRIDPTSENGKPKFTACYRCTVRLTIRDPHGNVVKISEDSATGVGENQPKRFDAHDKAHKEAVSYALKRCAKDLGDGYGLSLYNKGSLEPTVCQTLVTRGPSQSAANREAPQALSLGNDERDTPEPEIETSAPNGQVKTPPATATKSAGPPPGDVPHTDVLNAWLRLFERLPQVLSADKVTEFKQWGRAQGLQSKARTEGELDLLLDKARDMYRAEHPAHEWDADELKMVRDVLAALAEDDSAQREWGDFKAFVFDEFADLEPSTWTQDQYDKFLPWLMGPASSNGAGNVSTHA